MKEQLSMILTVLMIGFLAQNLGAQTPTKQPIAKTGVQKYTPKKQTYPKRASVAYRVDTVKNTDFSLNGQYQFMLSRSKTLNGYKLINPERLTTVWQSVSDTLKKERTELLSFKVKLAQQDNNIRKLQSEIEGKEDSLTTSNAKVNEITLLGLGFDKTTYHIIVWSIILVLGLALTIVIIRSSKNIIEAKHRTQLYDEVSAEYQAYKVKTNEQQRKLARELQDERNIIEELKGRS